MKADSDRGAIGAWAYRTRVEQGLSVEQVAARITELGHRVSPPTIRGVEAGTKQPGARLLSLMGQALDSTPPGSGAEPAMSDLATALGDLARELAAMRAEVEQVRLEREAWQRGVLEVLREYAGDQVPEPLLASLAPRPL